MKKNLFYLILILFSLGCSEKDRGFQFSDEYNDELGKASKATVVSEGCAFTDISYESNNETYSSKTEETITRLLNKYVTPIEETTSINLSGQVKYPHWFSNSEDKRLLCSVVENIRNTNVLSLPEAEQKVFFINAYNMLTIELILKNYFDLDNDSEDDSYQRSIRNINDLDDEVWDKFAWKVGGANYTLNQIEKEILIPMGDARIHFAVNCASKGCPPLRNEAFTLESIDQQLDEMSDFFIASEAYSYFDLDPDAGNYFEVSLIFKWYENDFINDKSGRYGSVRAFVVYHLKTSEEELGFSKKELLDEELWDMDYGSYSWELNEDGI